MEFYRPALLERDKHNRDEFTCEESAYADWLRRYAGRNRKGNTAATWVIADAQYRVACYATLTMSAVDRSAAPKPLAKDAPTMVPALLLGRLATDREFTGLGLGTAMVKHALATAAELNLKAACKAVVVTALSPAVYSWWQQRHGFVLFDRNDEANLDLYLLTKDIAATLSRP